MFFKKVSDFKGTEVSKYGQICRVFTKGDVVVEGGKPPFQFLVQICPFGFSQGWGSVSEKGCESKENRGNNCHPGSGSGVTQRDVLSKGEVVPSVGQLYLQSPGYASSH